MCNHYQAHPQAIADWAKWAGSRAVPRPEPALDLWPKRPATVARIDGGAKVLEAMTWGVPRTMPGKRPGTTATKHVTNVRNLTSPFWKSMLADPERRCLVPFTRFAEPKPGKDADTGRPAEYWFNVVDRPVAAFAGLWRPSQAGRVFAFLTCAPNPLVAPFHPKAMPVVLSEDAYDSWLTGTFDAACAHAMPFPSQLMALV